MRPRCLSCLAFALALVCGACSKRDRPTSTSVAGTRPSVILISIDTLRADHVGVRGLTPHIDAFAKKATRYLSAWSHAPLTLPAHASLLTGLLPTHHGVRDNLGYEVRGGRTLAERFKQAGYATGGFVSTTVLRRETGIGRGFDAFDDAMPTVNGKTGVERPGAATVENALAYVEAHRAKPFFLFVHLFDPHTPYAAPERFQTRGASAYDHEVAAADDAVGALLDGLEKRGIKGAIVALTADHGEGLGDHGEAEHGLLLHAEALRIPLLISSPDQKNAGTEVSATVRQIDIGASLLSRAGLATDEMDGTALEAGGVAGARPAYSETWYPRIHFGWNELASAAEGKWHFISGPKPELYDLESDPTERTNLSAHQGTPAPAMARFVQDQKKDASESRGIVSPQAEEQLRSLGYLGSRGFASTASGANPRDKLGFYQPFMDAFNQASASRDSGDFATAATAYRAAIGLVGREKGLVVPRLHLGLADCLARLGKTADAEKEFRAEMALDPRSIEARTGLGSLYWSLSRDAQAREVIAGIVTQNPKPSREDFAAVVRAFEVLGDAESAALWRSHARAAGVAIER